MGILLIFAMVIVKSLSTVFWEQCSINISPEMLIEQILHIYLGICNIKKNVYIKTGTCSKGLLLEGGEGGFAERWLAVAGAGWVTQLIHVFDTGLAGWLNGSATCKQAAVLFLCFIRGIRRWSGGVCWENLISVRNMGLICWVMQVQLTIQLLINGKYTTWFKNLWWRMIKCEMFLQI